MVSLQPEKCGRATHAIQGTAGMCDALHGTLPKDSSLVVVRTCWSSSGIRVQVAI